MEYLTSDPELDDLITQNLHVGAVQGTWELRSSSQEPENFLPPGPALDWASSSWSKWGYRNQIKQNVPLQDIQIKLCEP